MTRRTPIRIAAAAIALATLTLGACGDNGGDNQTAQTTTTTEMSASPSRTVEVEMRDIAFSPNQVDVRAGETVRFVFRNTGQIKHDAYIGDEAAQDDHEMEMREQDEKGGTEGMEGMEGAAGDDTGITIGPGETGGLTRTFETGDRLLIGCHQPGHYAAGMKLAINMS